MRYLFLVFFVLIVANTFSQLGPLSGSQPKSFSTVPDNLGFLDNSINAFTGQVQFSMPLMSISSQGNLNYPISIGYSSANMENLVSTWNRESPTSVLGLGWSMDVPRIVADHKNTGNRFDDEFFLVESGGSSQLLSAGSGEYYTQRYSNWRISYSQFTETWTIVKEDGTTYIYGDLNSARKTVRFMVKWGNWIGHSSQPANQSQMAYVWDLSEIKDTWGNKLLFEYQQTEEYVAAGNVASITSEKQHTKASYIKEIRNTYNEKIVFQYISKAGAEFKDPHNERPEPDPYQEKYETLALDKIQSYIDGAIAGEVRLGYSAIGSGELTKRILNSITQYSRLGNALPGFLFSYETLTGANFGALKQVTSPLKGTATFTYSKVTLSRTNLSTTIPAVANYTEPQIYFGNDYVVITRRDATSGHTNLPRTMIVHILTWDGGTWIQSDQYTIFNITLLGTGLGGSGNNPHNQEFQITLGKDFFAILPKSLATIYLFKRDEHRTGKWSLDSNNTIPSSSKHTLLSGVDFVFVGSKEGAAGNNNSFSWINGQWVRQTIVKSSPSSQYFYTVANNYILTHEDVSGTATDYVKIYYKQPSNPTWNSTSWQPIGGTNGDSYWHGTNSYAVMMAAGGNERIFTWDSNFNITAFDVGIQIADNSFVNNVNNSMAFMTALDGTIRGYSWRYDGVNWISSGMLDYYGPNVYFRNLFTLGDDYIFRPRMAQASPLIINNTMRSFDPATRSWSTPFEITANNGTNNPYVLLAGNNFVTTKGLFYFRNVDAVNSWSADPNIISSLNSVGQDFYLQGGLDFVGSGISGLSTSMIVRFKNGALVSGTATSLNGLIKDRPNVFFAPAQIGYNAIVTGLGGVSNMEDASSFQIYRKVGDSFQGSISAYVATQIEMNDGSSPATQVSYEYFIPTAAPDASGTVPQFNRVKSYSGTNLSNGYTNSYFYNGLDPNTLFALDASASPGFISFFFNHKYATGSLYKSTAYNNLGNVIAETWTNLQFDNRGPSNRSYSILPVFSSKYTDNQLLETSITYTSFGSVGASTIKGKSNNIQYLNESYAAPHPYSYYNLFLPTREETIRNGQTLSVSCTRWKDFGGGFIAPYQTYTWKNGSTDFSAYWNPNVIVPSSSWRLTNTNVSFNSRGLLMESIDGNNVTKSIIYHSTKPRVLAEVTKASSNQVLYEGFEDLASNFSTDARTGLKSQLHMNYNVNLPSAGSYKLTYWRKSLAGGDWQFIEQNISTDVVIGGGGLMIDEVRLCPVGAFMNTFSYDQWGNLISTCDTNNRVFYFEYDEFNRQKLSRDENKNIITYKSYNIKN